LLRRFTTAALAALALVAPAASAAPVRGPDVSNNNGCGVNWAAAHHAGYRFGFAKANEGTGFVDRCFAGNWGQLQHFGMVRGAYDFAHLTSNPVDEARTFLRVVRGGGGGLHRSIAVVDVEAFSSGSVTRNRRWVQAWINTVYTKGHPAKILVYSAPFFWNPQLGCWRPRGAGLWVATYGPRPSVPCGWPGWDFWQYTDGRFNFTNAPKSIPGIGPVDISIFSGNRRALVAYTEGLPLKPFGHRKLHPGDRGTDVRGLQHALNRWLRSHHSRQLTTDGDYGPRTGHAIRFVKYHLGFRHPWIEYPACSKHCQVWIAHPNKRPQSYRPRTRARADHWPHLGRRR
jgi:GH25 family lysozyme M1 (1,4-beta-N-acetylmuramidase)